MEKTLVSAATGALSPVIGKLAELLEKKYMLFKDARRNVIILKSELEHMHSFMERLSWVEDPNVQAKLWMVEVRELSYDIEDSIDDFMLRVEGGAPTNYKGFQGFIRRITSLFTKIKTRYRIAKEIQGLKEKVKEADERRARYKIDDNLSNHSKEAAVDSRVRNLYKDQSELVGIDGPKDELVKLLTEGGDGLNRNLQVSIVGPGGSGKTTLANQVYNKIGENFKHRAFVSVSRNPNMMNVLRTTYSQVIIPRYIDAPKERLMESASIMLREFRQLMDLRSISDEQQLMSEISNFLMDKRYLIVVDDIWDVETWEIIKCVFPTNTLGSRIITTTRILEVAESCCPSYENHVHNLSPLSAMDSKRLFLHRIFGSEDQCPSHLEHVSNKILTKCDGLPLAIIAVSGVLANKVHTEDQWNQVANSIGHSLERDRGVQGMMRILSLSYIDLPHHLKSCLLYLSIFPHKYAIEKKSLVSRWIAEGFIPQERGYTQYELGERCFLELIYRSLIQVVKTNVFGEVKTCQVHDVILDFIVSKSIEDNFVTIYGVPSIISGQQKKVRRLSLKDIHQEHGSLSSGSVISHARSVSVFDNFVKLPPLLDFQILRVLHIEACDLSQEHHRLASIGMLYQLKYLSLKNTKIQELPAKIEGLQSLETLNLRGNQITELPASIVRISGLVSLLIDGEVMLPDGFGDMLGLQELRLINVLKQSSNFWLELSKLTNIRDLGLSLESDGTNDTGRWNEYAQNMVSSICKLGTLNLHSLSIHIGKNDDDSFLHGPWCPTPSNLKRLVIKKRWRPQNNKVGGSQHPSSHSSTSSTSSPSSTSSTSSAHLSPHSHSPSPCSSSSPPSPSPSAPSSSPSPSSPPSAPSSPPTTDGRGGSNPDSTPTGSSAMKKDAVSSVPNWIGSTLVNLQELCLHVKVIGEEDVGILGSIPVLLRLVLYVQNEQPQQQQQKKKKEDKKEKKRDKGKEAVDEGKKDEEEEMMEKNKNKKMIMMKEEEKKLDEMEGRTRRRRKEKDVDAGTGSPHRPRRRQQQQEVVPQTRSSNRQLNISVSHGFHLLRYLKIDGTDPRVLGLKFGAGAMPRLEELVLMFKAAEEFDQTSEDFFFGIKNLSHLASINCEIDCFPEPEIIVAKLEAAIRRAVSTHPNHPRLTIRKKSLDSPRDVEGAYGLIALGLFFMFPVLPLLLCSIL